MNVPLRITLNGSATSANRAAIFSLRARTKSISPDGKEIYGGCKLHWFGLIGMMLSNWIAPEHFHDSRPKVHAFSA